MLTAEEHLRLIYNCTDPSDYLQLNISLNPDVLLLTKAINEARKEAIEECCRVALDYVSESEEILILDKKILSLINDLK